MQKDLQKHHLYSVKYVIFIFGLQKTAYSIKLKIEFEIIEWFLFTQFGI